MPDRPSSVAAMRAAWGDEAPREIVILAENCDALGSQSLAAQKLGYSPAVISSALRRKYRGSYPKLYEAITGAWMGRSVTCPVLGPISGSDCLKHQKVARPANAQEVRLFRACRSGCPHSDKAPYSHVKKRT